MTGERIKKLRKEKGLTQEQLGNLLGVKKSAIAKYENNRVSNLKKDTIQKLSEIFDVSPSYFLGFEESNQPVISDSIQYANGDSMIDENINPGDLIVFEKINTLRNGDIGCFTIDDNVATCKKFYRDNKNRCIILQPANQDYSPIVINQENEAGFRIIGKLSLVINKR